MNSSFKFLNFSSSSSKSTPLAESTAIGSPISRHMLANAKRKSISPLHNPSKMRTAVKIDPHVLTDAQSSGIVSRLVKYYDNSTSEQDRSRIVYNKFGDYPIVHLKKTEYKRPIVRSTSVRIAPPSKSIMNPTLRAAIMRSNSFNGGVPKIAPTKMRVKDDSHQIIRNHEPIVDINYSTSAKSVLDALEKNCRKRINNEELNLDRSKKFCGPPQQNTSETDAPPPQPAREFAPIIPPVSAKRIRDISPIKSTASLIEASQLAKKLKTTRNNALMSSLSSSHYELIPYKVANDVLTRKQSTESNLSHQSFISALSSVSGVTTKPPEEGANKDDGQLSRQSSQESVSSLKPPPVAEIEDKEELIESQRKLHLFNVKPNPNRAKPKPARNDDDDDDDDDDEATIRFVKPKGATVEIGEGTEHPGSYNLPRMLFGLSTGWSSPPLRYVKESKDTVDTADKASKDEKSEEKTETPAATISFVTSTTTSTAAPILSSTTSSVISFSSTSAAKLPETKENSEKSSSDALSAPALVTGSAISQPVTTEMPKSILKGFQFGSTTPSTPSDASKNLISFATPIASILTAPATATATTTSVSSSSDQVKPLISFTPQAQRATSSESTTVNAATVTAPSVLPTFGSVANTAGFKFGASSVEPPKVGTGFSFGSNSSTNAVAPTLSGIKPTLSFEPNQSALLKPQPSLTSSLLPPITTQASVLNVQKPATATSGGFSFGSTAGAAASSQGISFGGGEGSSIPGIAPLAKSPSFSKPETTVASGVGFSFGGNKPVMTFGGMNSASSNNPIAPATTTNSSPAPSTFSFSNNNQVAPNSSIGFPAPSNTLAPAPSFSFGSSSTNGSAFTAFGAAPKTEAQPTAGIFSFAQQQKPQTATPSLPSAVSSNPSPSFNFGGSNAAPSASPFGFGKPEEKQKAGGIFSRLGEKLPATNEAKPFSFNANAGQQNNASPFTLAAPASNASIFNQATSPVFGQNSIIGNNNGSGGGVSSNNLFAQSSQTPQASVFGGATQPQQQQQQQQSSSMFSFNPPQNNDLKKTSKFCFVSPNANAGSNALAPTSTTPNLFGNARNTGASSQNVSASFTFNPNTGGIASSSSANVFGQSQNTASSGPAPPSYQFGSGNNQNGGSSNNVSVSYNFAGAAASAPTPQTNSNAFNFGSAAPQLQPSNSAGAGGGFNFQAPSQQQLLQQQQQQNAGGVFNIGTAGNQNQRRFIRTASRRFK